MMSAINAKALAVVAALSVGAWVPALAQSPISAAEAADHSPAAGAVPQKNSKPSVAELFKRSVDLIENERASDAIPVLRRALELAPKEGRLHHYLGYALMKTNQYPAAQKEFETALRLEPGNVYSEYFLARTLDAQGLGERALELYEAVLASGTVLYDTYQRLGQAYTRKKQFDKAEAMIQEALQQTPWEGALHYQLGVIYRQTGRVEAARQEFETAQRLKSTDQVSIQKTLELESALRRKDTARALALRRELMEESGREPELMTWLGMFLGRAGLYHEALAPLQKAAAAGPCSYETCYNLGLTLAKLGQDQEAESPLKQALTLRPESYEANVVLAVAYVNQGRNREAIERLRAAQAAKPYNLSVLLLLGQQYLEGWYVQQAIDSFRAALKLKPDESRTRYLLIDACQKNKAYDQALEAARETLRLFSQEARAHFEVGRQLANMGRYQESRRFFLEAVRLDRAFVQGYIGLGETQSHEGKYEAALASYRQAGSLNAGDLEAARGVGRNLIRLKRFSEAAVELSKAIADHPEDSELHLQLSQVYDRLGKSAEAERARAVFQTLHTRELEAAESQKPRTFSP